MSRPKLPKEQKLIRRDYYISEQDHIDLIKISSIHGGNLSFHVRAAIGEYKIKKLTKIK